MRVVELVGLPGAGKSVLVEAMRTHPDAKDDSICTLEDKRRGTCFRSGFVLFSTALRNRWVRRSIMARVLARSPSERVRLTKLLRLYGEVRLARGCPTRWLLLDQGVLQATMAYGAVTGMWSKQRRWKRFIRGLASAGALDLAVCVVVPVEVALSRYVKRTSGGGNRAWSDEEPAAIRRRLQERARVLQVTRETWVEVGGHLVELDGTQPQRQLTTTFRSLLLETPPQGAG